MKAYIQKLKHKDNLDPHEIEAVMQLIMSGQAAKEDIADFLLALNEKGATVEEITGAAKIMRNFCREVKTEHEVVLDTCGTGGDQLNTFNISTASAFVVAGAGVIVAKHGNRSASSQCGSADVLEALGVNLNIEEAQVSECLDKVGIAFLFAQKLHPAMKNVAGVRKELGIKTIFNILGPLTNPAQATHQVMGVYSRDLIEPMAHVLKNLGLKRALVVHGSDGLDEITVTGKTFVSEFNGRSVMSYDIDPQELGVKRYSIADIRGGDLKTNVRIINQVFDGMAGAHRDIVALNAAYALYTAEKVDTINKGIRLAEKSIDSGQAGEKLEQLKEYTNHV
ncbi:MAG: anthranilate phosphoribosyltransferase [Omnitrophica WOR_2 bacterium RIFCSPHIGHO2_02_FULL_48_11]|nr:MAG: anthranilate phosphoribosyltransferase [Omnitrophica WOR_2 bacterium RIFCSPHIGHO2_02_FULL_48_11]